MPPRPLPSPAARRLWTLQTFVLLLILWVALDGFATVGVGLLFAALGALLGGWLVPGEPYPWRPLRLAGFALYFLRTSFRGGLDVGWRALHPRLPIDPGMLDYQCGLPPGLPRTAFIAICNLQPGTLCVDMDDDGHMRIHALNRAGACADLVELESRLQVLFSLDRAAAAHRA